MTLTLKMKRGPEIYITFLWGHRYEIAACLENYGYGAQQRLRELLLDFNFTFFTEDRRKSFAKRIRENINIEPPPLVSINF